jgi:EAL domain-containing protein (putative c-di-GMP-specific phosphodiesterase class I)
MSLTSRLLGMAFASADVLFELDQMQIAFAIGAGPVVGVDPGAAWVGHGLDELLDAESRAPVRTAISALTSGLRSEPLDVRILTGDGRARRASLRAFILPELAPFVSCALVWDGAAFAIADAKPRPLLDARGLLRRLTDLMAQGTTDPALSVAFVEVPGLDIEDEPHRRASARIEAHLQAASLEGSSAARLSADRFAVMRNGADIADLAAAVRAVGQAEGLDLSPIATSGEFGEANPAVAVRTLRLALDACLKDGARAGAHFGDRLKRTVEDADRFRGIVRDRQFALAWQPIVSLESRAVHHFEALARLGGSSQAPVAPIAMAEELGLIDGFDLAVAEKALLQLRQPGFGLVKAAINASGVSINGDAYVEGLLRMTASAPQNRKRLMIEVTETAAIIDLESANRRLRALRAAGMKVCLDDFGAGSASFDYLRRLEVDIVKLDGAFVRDLATEPRARTLAGHLIELCRDLKIQTVAEMIETEAQAATVKALKVDFGQGWLFGRPSPTPVIPAAAPLPARRVGEVTGWG